MKNIASFLPVTIIAAAVVLGLYYFYFKPKQDAIAAANAKAQSDYEAGLTAYDTGYAISGLKLKYGGTIQAAPGAINKALVKPNFAAILKSKS